MKDCQFGVSPVNYSDADIDVTDYQGCRLRYHLFGRTTFLAVYDFYIFCRVIFLADLDFLYDDQSLSNNIGLNIFIPQYVHEQYKDMQKH